MAGLLVGWVDRCTVLGFKCKVVCVGWSKAEEKRGEEGRDEREGR